MSERAGDFLEAFLARVDAAPESVAIEMEGEGRTVTYAELLALAGRFRAALVRLGVGEGDPVLLALPSGPELVASFFALASLGARAVPINEQLTAFELAPILADARPVGAIVAHPGVARAVGACRTARFLLCAGAGSCEHGDERLVALGDDRAAITPPGGNPIVSCHFTYKGLGYPLGALHRYSSWGSCLDGVVNRYGASAEGTHLVALPMYPIYGLLGTVLLPLTLGARLLIVRKVSGRDLFDLLASHRIRFACLVPLLLRVLAANARERGPAGVRKALHPNLELGSAGSHLSAELAGSVFDALGAEPLQGYGLTETLPVTVSWRGTNLRGALGKPLRDDVRIAVVDARGRELPAGRVGEVVVSGPTVMHGFVNRPRETTRFLRDGRFHTGDLGHLDREGFLHFDGRSLPFTKIAAQMVDLREIETLLLRHPKIADARATVRDERVGVSVILTRHASMTESDVVAFCAQHLSKHKVPRAVKLYERAIQALAVNQ